MDNITDIVELLKHYEIQLTPVGDRFMCHCLFHSGDNTPSMCIYPQTNSFYCFGCNQSGDIITLLMKLEKISYTEAVQQLYGAGYEWIKLKKEAQVKTRMDEVYLYRILARNIKRQIQKIKNETNTEQKLLTIRKVLYKYTHNQLEPQNLFQALKEIKQL
jgi:DNA primase